MEDARGALLQDVQHKIMPLLSDSDYDKVMTAVTLALGNYEVSKRTTELTIIDDYNEKIIKRHCACLRIEGKSLRTIAQYNYTCRKLSDYLHKNFNEMTMYDIMFFLAHLKETNCNSSLENQRSYIASFFKWMKKGKLITDDPCENINPIKFNTEEKIPFSSIDIDAMRSVCKKDKERAVVETLLSSGVRCEELVNLNIEDVDFQSLSVHVRHGKGDKERMTYITPLAAKYIKIYLGKRTDNSNILFMSQRKDRYTTDGIERMLKTLGNRAGVDNVYPHRFRHTLASNLADKGMAIQEIQQILGHSNVNTTMRYVYSNKTRVQSSYRKYAD